MGDFFDPAFCATWEQEHRTQHDINHFLHKRMVALKANVDLLKSDFEARVSKLEATTVTQRTCIEMVRTSINGLEGAMTHYNEQLRGVNNNFDELKVSTDAFVEQTNASILRFRKDLLSLTENVRKVFDAEENNAKDIIEMRRIVDAGLIETLIKSYRRIYDELDHHININVKKEMEKIEFPNLTEIDNNLAELKGLLTEVKDKEEETSLKVVALEETSLKVVALEENLEKTGNIFDERTKELDEKVTAIETDTVAKVKVIEKSVDDLGKNVSGNNNKIVDIMGKYEKLNKSIHYPYLYKYYRYFDELLDDDIILGAITYFFHKNDEGFLVINVSFQDLMCATLFVREVKCSSDGVVSNIRCFRGEELIGVNTIFKIDDLHSYMVETTLVLETGAIYEGNFYNMSGGTEDEPPVTFIFSGVCPMERSIINREGLK